MAKSIVTGSSKKKRGRPVLYEGGQGKGAPQIGLRLPPAELASVDAWIKHQPKPKPSRPAAIRRLVEIALAVKHKRKQAPAGAVRAKELAATAIDKMSDGGATADDQASRKRRLLKGPEEFR